MSNPVVKCTVGLLYSLYAWGTCMAAKISVYNDEAKGNSSTSEDTLCKSFHPRGSVGDMVGAFHNANVGGV